ncbi:MAG: hypothetical protein M3O15_02480 [Acidobacteriota bacterium]|nr:hypothetical protein [Acidobacteriota bacterium]
MPESEERVGREAGGPAPPDAGSQGVITRVLLILVLAQLAWCSAFIARSSFRLGGARHFSLFDDALISLSYARHLVDGFGLNWARQGAPVEGFTHPLWVLLMVPANLGLPLRLRCLPVQILSAALLLAETVLLARCARRHFSTGATCDGLPAAAATAFYFPLSYWALAGMESALQALLTTAAVSLALDLTERRWNRAAVLWLTLALAYLLRMDMLLLAAVVWAFVLWRTRGEILRTRAFWLGALTFVLAVLGYELFRFLYFGDLLPNTYYLKLTGVPLEVRLLRGLATFGDFARDNALLLGCAAAGTFLAWRTFRSAVLLPAAIFTACCLYDVWLGGDAFEGITLANRFLCFVIPLLFLLFGAGTAALGERFRFHPSQRTSLAAAAALALVLLENGLVRGDAAAHWRDLLIVNRPGFADRSEQLLTRLGRLERILAPTGRVATSFAGIPAFWSDYQLIDILGYNDRELAHRPTTVPLSRANFRDFRPGHNKWDYEAVFRRQPDAFFTTYGIDAAERWELMSRHGYVPLEGFWVRPGSPALLRTPPLRAPDS